MVAARATSSSTERRHGLDLAVGSRSPTTGPIQALRTLGLTPAEARIAGIIGVGFSPAEAAEALNIKVATVRLVMKSIFAKLGVRRQSELANLVSQLMVVR